MNETTEKKIIATVNEVSPNGDKTHHVSFVLDQEISAGIGQYIVFYFEKDGKTVEHKHIIQNKYTNSKTLEENVNFDDVEESFFAPILKKGAIFSVSKPANFNLKEKLENKLAKETFWSIGKKLIIAGVVLIIIFTAIFGKDKVINFFNPINPIAKPSFEEVIKLSTNGTDQKPLQDFFIEQIKSGKNDDNTQVALMWITHRYFDNGGDINEIYDFVNAHSEISFLKEAEKIHPEVFLLVKEKKVKNYDAYSLMALLAYFEIANKYNYANLGMLGIGANKYAELAYGAFNAANATNVHTEELKFSKLYYEFKNKSLMFSVKANDYINEKTKLTGKINDLETAGLREDTLLVGLNQFASAQYFYKGMDMPFISTIPPEEIFAFNVDFSRRKFVRLYLFTNYLWAFSLENGKSANMLTLMNPLNNIIEYARANKNIRPEGSLSRIIHSNTNGETGLFSQVTAKALASEYKPFREWLREVGWREQDFK